MKDSKIINIAAVPHRSPFRYPGGKTWLVPRIRAWLLSLPAKPHEFAEPFAGGAIVGLSALFEDLVERLVLVEMDEDVGAVWQVLLAGQAEKLGARIVDFEVTLESVKKVLAKPATAAPRSAFMLIRRIAVSTRFRCTLLSFLGASASPYVKSGFRQALAPIKGYITRNSSRAYWTTNRSRCRHSRAF